jgi:hypothetical protein
MASTVTPITWRNVNAPDGTGALNAFARAGDSLGRSIGGFGDAIQEGANQYADSQTESFIAELNAAPDDAARKQMVQQASEAFLKMGKVNAAVTNAQNQDFLVNAEARNQGRFGFEQAAEAYREKTRPLSLRGLEATTETSERANDIGALYDKSNAELDNELKILRNKYKEETDPLLKQQLEQGISVTAEALRFSKAANVPRLKKLEDDLVYAKNKDDRNAAKLALEEETARQNKVIFDEGRDDRTLNAPVVAGQRVDALANQNRSATIRDNDAAVKIDLDIISNPNAPMADRNAAIGRVETALSSELVSPEVSALANRATSAAVAAQNEVPSEVGSVRSIARTLLSEDALTALDTQNTDALIRAAPKNFGSLLEQEVVKRLRKLDQFKGVSQPALKQIAKQQIMGDTEIGTLIASAAKRDEAVAAADALSAAGTLASIKIEEEMVTELRTDQAGLARRINKTLEDTGRPTVDLGKLTEVIQKFDARASEMLRKAGIGPKAAKKAIVKLLKLGTGDRDALVNDFTLPGFGEGLFDDDMSNLSDSELMRALDSQLESKDRALLAFQPPSQTQPSR